MTWVRKPDNAHAPCGARLPGLSGVCFRHLPGPFGGGGRPSGHEADRGGFFVDTGGCCFPVSPTRLCRVVWSPRTLATRRPWPALIARTLLSLCPLGLCGFAFRALCAGFGVGPVSRLGSLSPVGRARPVCSPGCGCGLAACLFCGEDVFSETLVQGGNCGPISRGCRSRRVPSCGRPAGARGQSGAHGGQGVPSAAADVPSKRSAWVLVGHAPRLDGA